APARGGALRLREGCRAANARGARRTATTRHRPLTARDRKRALSLLEHREDTQPEPLRQTRRSLPRGGGSSGKCPRTDRRQRLTRVSFDPARRAETKPCERV